MILSAILLQCDIIDVSANIYYPKAQPIIQFKFMLLIQVIARFDEKFMSAITKVVDAKYSSER